MRASPVIASVPAAATSDRSARRQTVRATCASAAARVPPGQHEFLQRREVGVETLDVGFEPRDMRIGDGLPAGNRQFAAEVEQIVLDRCQALRERVGQPFGEQDADRRIEFVDVADGGDPRRILRHPRAVAQAGGTGVAGARDDPG